MSTFRWRDGWAMKDNEIEADHVTFEPSHVVFRRQDGRVIRAIPNTTIADLTDTSTEVID